MTGIDKITLAVSDMDAMKQFYGAIFASEFVPMELAGYELFSTGLGEMELLLCPKELAEVEASINTVQLRFVVEDVAAAFAAGMANGGTEITAPQILEGRLHASLRDPDWNSLELIAPSE